MKGLVATWIKTSLVVSVFLLVFTQLRLMVAEEIPDANSVRVAFGWSCPILISIPYWWCYLFGIVWSAVYAYAIKESELPARSWDRDFFGICVALGFPAFFVLVLQTGALTTAIFIILLCLVRGGFYALTLSLGMCLGAGAWLGIADGLLNFIFVVLAFLLVGMIESIKKQKRRAAR